MGTKVSGPTLPNARSLSLLDLPARPAFARVPRSTRLPNPTPGPALSARLSNLNRTAQPGSTEPLSLIGSNRSARSNQPFQIGRHQTTQPGRYRTVQLG